MKIFKIIKSLLTLIPDKIKMKKPRISIQVVNYNGKRFLKNCFDSLLKQDYPNFEIVFVDNGSIDGSIKFIKEKYKNKIKKNKIKIISLKKNYGFAEGSNIAYKQTKTDYVLLINNDTIVPQKNLLSLLLQSAQKHDAALTGALEHPIDKTNFKENKKCPTMGILNFPAQNVIPEKEIFIIGAGCLLVDKHKIDYLFLKEYFAYGEDAYLGWRTRIRGYKIILVKKVIYLHYGAGTSGKRSFFTRYHSEKNRLANLLIFYEIKTLLKIFPLFIFEFLVKLIYSLRHPKLFFAPFLAIIWNLNHLKFIIKNRRKIQKERKVKDKELIKLMSYKIFPEHISPKISSPLNSFIRIYCKIFGIKTYDLN